MHVAACSCGVQLAGAASCAARIRLGRNQGGALRFDCRESAHHVGLQGLQGNVISTSNRAGDIVVDHTGIRMRKVAEA